MKVIVPLQIKSLPPSSEERIESNIIVLVRTFDKLILFERQRFLLDRFPIGFYLL